jgi:serine/threonine-protein kinase
MTESFDRLKTALADRFQIAREIGSGGMATVYLAQDLKHERDVAVKVFRPELSVALGSQRFLREIKITAGLSHPHILPLLDSGEADSFFFYAMPYVEGESLRDKLNRERELGTEEAIRITEQVASALSYAHSKEIVHRDIKPENILLQSDQVVVADFGIALAIDTAGGARLTETGLSIGTPAYMSPEQVAGEKEIDARSDIYSLACVLYEMLAGDPPFTASNPRAVLARHLTDPAPPVTTVRPGVSEPVAAAIAKALEKAPADRFDSAKAFSVALSAPSVAHEERQTKSILVLPFANLSPDPDNEYFSDGLTEEVITDLSKVGAIRVISRNSAMQLKGTDKSTGQICRELGVQFVLEGSVRKAGNRLRITAQLTDGGADEHVWAEKYDGLLEDVFDIQESVSRSIVESLKLTLSPEEDDRLAERPIDDLQAYECYLRAREEFWKYSEGGLERALVIIQNGLETLGEKELLYVGMGTVHAQYMHFGEDKDESHLERAEECIEKVFSFNPESSQGHYLKGFTQWYRGAHAAAVRHLKKALSIDPNHADALTWLGWIYANYGKGSAARPLLDKARELDPLNFSAHGHTSGSQMLEGDFPAALGTIRRCEKLFPASPWLHLCLAFWLVYNDRIEEANGYLDLLEGDPTRSVWAELGLFLRYALKGDKEQALESVTDRLRVATRRNEFLPLLMAECYALIDEIETAIDWLEEAVKWGCKHYRFLNEYGPLLENVRGEERFKRLMERVKHESEAFEI